MPGLALPSIAARHFLRICAAWLAAGASCGPVHAAPIETYAQLPSVEEVSISPDGSKLAFVRTDGDTRIVAIYSLAEHKTVKVLRVRELKLRSMTWADDDRVLITTSETGMPWGFVGEDTEWYQMQVLDLKKDRNYQVPDLDRNHDGLNVMNVIAGEVMVRNVQGHTVLFIPGIYAARETMPCLIRYDLETRRQQVQVQGGANSRGWLVDAEGEVVAQEDYDQESGRWRMRIAREGKLVDAASGNEGIDVPSILGFGPSEDALLTRFLEKGDPVWKLLYLSDGHFGPPMEERKSLDRPIEDPYTHRMIGGVRIDDDDNYVFFEAVKQKRWDSIRKAYGKDQARFVSASRDFKKIVVLVEGRMMGFQYQVVDFETHHTTSIGDVYKGITSTREVRKISYRAADGLEIPAYLTLPAGRTPEGLPLVVLPHGGPAVRDTMEFDWWSQALADQGYAVLRPNYRGSTVNHEFMTMGYGQFGRKMQNDLADGVRYLVREGMVDPARVCIAGASYGGYAALAGVALDPGVYRCAASVAGISDLRVFLSWVDDKHWSSENREQRYWDRFLGVKNRKDPKLDEISPIKHIDAITVPVLLVHGKDDTVVPYDQSDDMYDALRHAHKPVELVKLENEDHWLSRGATRLQMLQAVVAFLQKNNPAN